MNNPQEIKLGNGLVAYKKETKPPARYSEATFIKQLQSSGIGRPSTYASILETILSQARNYCQLDNKQIVPTEKGIALSKFLDRAFSDVININYTRLMEQDLDLIAEGKLDETEFLRSFFETLERMIKENKEVQESETIICPDCGANMILRRNRFGKLFYGCSNYPKCHGIVNKN